MMWSPEARAAVDALEDKYDISVCSTEHLESWVNRCERLEAAMKESAEEIEHLREEIEVLQSLVNKMPVSRQPLYEEC